MPVSAREASYNALTRYRRYGSFPEKSLDATSLDVADPRDVALAQRIVLGVLQNTALIDHYIASYSTVRLNRIEPHVLDIMRLSVYQIAFLTKVPASAAVNEGVALVKKHAGERPAPFANAVLRKIAANAASLPPVVKNTELERLSTQYSHPKWLVETFTERFGAQGAQELLQANNAFTPIYARVNTIKTNAREALDELISDGTDARETDFPGGFLELRNVGSVENLKAFQNGHIYIQDPGAYLVTLAAGIKPGDTVLDACSAPGGKAFAAAIDMGGKGRVLAFDLPKKTWAIEDGANRLGLENVSVAAADATVPTEKLFGVADVVLADVPCSGFGVIRKKPEIRYKTREEIKELPDKQLAIVQNLAKYVKPGGVLLYSTCTLTREENEGVTDAFLRAAPDFAPEDFTLPVRHGDSAGGMITLSPHIHRTDGFYICKLRKKK
jgi:16S rRNA (cytosine967-C5)-methyltransferase